MSNYTQLNPLSTSRFMEPTFNSSPTQNATKAKKENIIILTLTKIFLIILMHIRLYYQALWSSILLK